MISVCIATYNGEKYIQEQLNSILPQLQEHDEIIISDDGSTDGTIEQIRQIGSPLIHIYKNTGEHGYTRNFENALSLAKGEYIFLCDQDDIWQPDKVNVCLKALEQYDYVVHDAMPVDADGNKLADSFCALRKSRFGFWPNLIRFSYIGCCMAFRRKLLNKALPFPKNQQLCTHDNWLYMVGTAFFKARFINRQLILYRRYGSNASSGWSNKHTSVWFKIHYRLYIVKWLMIRWLK